MQAQIFIAMVRKGATHTAEMQQMTDLSLEINRRN